MKIGGPLLNLRIQYRPPKNILLLNIFMAVCLADTTAHGDDGLSDVARKAA